VRVHAAIAASPELFAQVSQSSASAGAVDNPLAKSAVATAVATKAPEARLEPATRPSLPVSTASLDFDDSKRARTSARAINHCGGAMTSVCGVKVNAATGLADRARDNHGER
jgi:hypothetical protein